MEYFLLLIGYFFVVDLIIGKLDRITFNKKLKSSQDELDKVRRILKRKAV